MKKVINILFILSICVCSAQRTGVIVEEYGKVYPVENPDNEFEKNKKYKVIFDIYTDSPKSDMDNPMLKKVARYLQIHIQKGVPKENIKVTVLLHGLATKNVLTDKAYKKQFNIDNPNTELLRTLKNSGVVLFVPEDSLADEGYASKDKSYNVRIATSALTELEWHQNNGYKIVNFN